jgi:hypothetical protein
MVNCILLEIQRLRSCAQAAYKGVWVTLCGHHNFFNTVFEFANKATNLVFCNGVFSIVYFGLLSLSQQPISGLIYVPKHYSRMCL